MKEIYQIWDYDEYIAEMEEVERKINFSFDEISKIGKNNCFSDEDIANLEYYLAILEEYNLLKFSEVKR